MAFVRDDNAGCLRPSSAAFKDDRDGDPMSVCRQDVIESEGSVPDRVLAGDPGSGLVSVSAGQVTWLLPWCGFFAACLRRTGDHVGPVPDRAALGPRCRSCHLP